MYCTKLSLEATLINNYLLLLTVPVITFNKSLLKFKFVQASNKNLNRRHGEQYFQHIHTSAYFANMHLIP